MNANSKSALAMSTFMLIALPAGGFCTEPSPAPEKSEAPQQQGSEAKKAEQEPAKGTKPIEDVHKGKEGRCGEKSCSADKGGRWKEGSCSADKGANENYSDRSIRNRCAGKDPPKWCQNMPTDTAKEKNDGGG
jgi:hypothetical protein